MTPKSNERIAILGHDRSILCFFVVYFFFLSTNKTGTKTKMLNTTSTYENQYYKNGLHKTYFGNSSGGIPDETRKAS